VKNNIPINKVSSDYAKLLNAFINSAVTIENDNIISIFLTGSFARGEATENSDLDIWCVFKTLDSSTLFKIGEIVRNLPISYNNLEINAQCLTLDELKSKNFSKFLAYPIVNLEGILLFGIDLAIEKAKTYDVEKIYKEMIAEILLSVRHYIAVKEPVEKLTHQKIKTWVLKPLMFALRLERYLHTKQYPLTISDLSNAYNPTLISIKYYIDKNKWDFDLINNYYSTLNALHNEIEKLLK